MRNAGIVYVVQCSIYIYMYTYTTMHALLIYDVPTSDYFRNEKIVLSYYCG